jgi:hypothetical protein
LRKKRTKATGHRGDSAEALPTRKDVTEGCNGKKPSRRLSPSFANTEEHAMEMGHREDSAEALSARKAKTQPKPCQRGMVSRNGHETVYDGPSRRLDPSLASTDHNPSRSKLVHRSIQEELKYQPSHLSRACTKQVSKRGIPRRLRCQAETGWVLCRLRETARRQQERKVVRKMLNPAAGRQEMGATLITYPDGVLKLYNAASSGAWSVVPT